MKLSRLAAVVAMAVMLAGVGRALAEDATPRKSLKDALLPVPKDNGFSMPGFYLWCSSVVKVGDTYHMFASRWPDSDKGMGLWTSQSECVRATSKDLLGPYTFQEVVLQKRPTAWDNSRVHNVKLVQAGGKFVLFYINSANDTGFATADSVTGPWTRYNDPVIKASNPAPLVMPDQSVYVFCRLRDKDQINRGVAFKATSFQGPYQMLANGDNLLPNGGELEDPTIWLAHGQYNVVLNDWKGHATGVSKGGAQYFSKDGIHYELFTKDAVFTKKIQYDDKTTEMMSRRERPFCYTNEKGEVTALFTACLPQNGPARIIAQPVNNYVPNN